MLIPGVAGRIVGDPVTLADIAPTAARLLGAGLKDVDGVDLGAGVRRRLARARAVRRVVRAAGGVRLGAASVGCRSSDPGSSSPRRWPELFDIGAGPGGRADESRGVAAVRSCAISGARRSLTPLRRCRRRASAHAGGRPRRLRALGYSSRNRQIARSAINRPDPKDRRELCWPHRSVSAGEGPVRRRARVRASKGSCATDPRNGQAHRAAGLRAPAGR